MEQFCEVGVTHAAGEEATERPSMDTRREGRHCSRVRIAFQKGAVWAKGVSAVIA